MPGVNISPLLKAFVDFLEATASQHKITEAKRAITWHLLTSKV